jgi:hypothetical protein
MNHNPIDTSGFPPEARRYVERLWAIIERDRTAVAHGVREVRKAVTEHEWLRLGRGSYEYDDERWKDEFGDALDTIERAMEPLRIVAANLRDSPVETEAVAAARAIPLSATDIARKAWSDAEETAFQAGVEAMRELAGHVAIHACLTPPDGGSPTDDEREMCAEVARQIYAAGMPLKLTDGSRG